MFRLWLSSKQPTNNGDDDDVVVVDDDDDNDDDDDCSQLSRKYGSVFTVYLGARKVVVLAGYKTVKEALVNHSEEFGDRSPIPLAHNNRNGE